MGAAPGDEAMVEVLAAFRFDGVAMRWAPLPGGHIHRNLLVTCAGGRYVLQRLNGRVFPDLDAVVSNGERVAAHLAAHGRGGAELVETHDGALSHRGADGSRWRAFSFLEGTVGRSTPAGPGDAFEAGRVFADYRVALEDLPGPPLAVTIAHFHDLDHRLATLETVDRADPVGRRSGVTREVDRTRRLGRAVADALASAPGAPRRTVHNDAKLANVRFDAGTGLATCVVDFDTTMPGYVRHDVGELVRTVTTYTPEDGGGIDGVDVDLELLDALAAGYLGGHLELAASEMATLALAGPEMAVENAARFLTDYLDGDRYFAVDHQDQNLDRCRTQLRLTELLLEDQAEADASFGQGALMAVPAEAPDGTGPTEDGG